MPVPEARKSGNHSVRWRTTSRAAQPATGDGASHDRVPRTRSVNCPATCRCRSAGRSGSAMDVRTAALAELAADHADVADALARRATEVVGQREGLARGGRGDLALPRLAPQLQPALEQHTQPGRT